MRQFVLTVTVALLVGWGHAAGPAGLPSPPPVFVDDLELRDLEIALVKSIAYLETLPPRKRFTVTGEAVSVQHLIDSVRALHQLIRSRPTPEALNRLIHSAFRPLAMHTAALAETKRMLITGYYQPLFAGSLTRQPPYLYPLHRIPDDLLVRELNGRKQVLGRSAPEGVVPYWTRREIEQGNLLRGQELVWLADPFDAFVLHVQGSGTIRLPGGAVRGVRYVLNNGREYRSIGKFLVDTGRMPLADVTMDSIRQYVADHPEERELILHQNESYIFFQWGVPGAAIGNLGQELTPGRSVAADQRCYPPGAVVFVDSRRPIMTGDQVVEWQRMHRLVTVQDTGSALRGPGRLDVFWGSGDQAGREAGQMKEGGSAWVLLLKEGIRVEAVR